MNSFAIIRAKNGWTVNVGMVVIAEFYTYREAYGYWSYIRCLRLLPPL